MLRFCLGEAGYLVLGAGDGLIESELAYHLKTKVPITAILGGWMFFRGITMETWCCVEDEDLVVVDKPSRRKEKREVEVEVGVDFDREAGSEGSR